MSSSRLQFLICGLTRYWQYVWVLLLFRKFNSKSIFPIHNTISYSITIIYLNTELCTRVDLTCEILQFRSRYVYNQSWYRVSVLFCPSRIKYLPSKLSNIDSKYYTPSEGYLRIENHAYCKCVFKVTKKIITTHKILYLNAFVKLKKITYIRWDLVWIQFFLIPVPLQSWLIHLR